MAKQSNLVDQYIDGFSGETQKQLKQIRDIIRGAAPQAEEYFAYGMPGYRVFGNHWRTLLHSKTTLVCMPCLRGTVSSKRSLRNIREEKDRFSFQTMNHFRLR